jgi:hypothetical protein
MAKRPDHDATQEVSASMLVPDRRPPAKPPQSAPKNDASMWMQAPVSADDFVSAPRRKPVAPGGGGRAVLVAVMVATFVAVTGAGVWYAFLRESPKTTSAFDKPTDKPTTPAATPAVGTSVTDAAVAVAAADAAAAAHAIDAGAAPAVGALQVDAISGADPAVKKTKKRATTKKAVTKKKTATAPKKRK